MKNLGEELTLEEKNNARKYFDNNLKKITDLKKQIAVLRAKNKKLSYYLDKKPTVGMLFEIFGKHKSDLTREEFRAYERMRYRLKREKEN